MRRVILSHVHAAVAAVIVTLLAVPSQAQETKSAAGAVELAQVLAAKKLDAIAARDPLEAQWICRGLGVPRAADGHRPPATRRRRSSTNDWRAASIATPTSSSMPRHALESRVFVTDIGADGLKPKIAKKAVAFDIRDVGGKQFKFDGNWREDKMSETDYMKVFAEADEHYAHAVALLLAEAKK